MKNFLQKLVNKFRKCPHNRYYEHRWVAPGQVLTIARKCADCNYGSVRALGVVIGGNDIWLCDRWHDNTDIHIQKPLGK